VHGRLLFFIAVFILTVSTEGNLSTALPVSRPRRPDRGRRVINDSGAWSRRSGLRPLAGVKRWWCGSSLPAAAWRRRRRSTTRSQAAGSRSRWWRRSAACGLGRVLHRERVRSDRATPAAHGLDRRHRAARQRARSCCRRSAAAGDFEVGRVQGHGLTGRPLTDVERGLFSTDADRSTPSSSARSRPDADGRSKCASSPTVGSSPASRHVPSASSMSGGLEDAVALAARARSHHRRAACQPRATSS